MTAADIVSWSIPFINQTAPVILVISIIAFSDNIINFFINMFGRYR